jgi:hypothetical protein
MNRLLAFLFFLVLPIASFSQNFDKILKDNIISRGGQSALDTVKTYTIKGELIRDDSVKQKFKASCKMGELIYIDSLKKAVKTPDKYRIEIYVETDTFAFLSDGKRAWALMPQLSPEPIELPKAKTDEAYLAIVKPVLDYDCRLEYYKANKYKSKINKNDSINLIPQYTILCSKDDNTDIVYVSQIDNLLTQINSSYFIGGKTLPAAIKLSDYRKVGDIVKPYKISIINGKSIIIDLTISDYIINKELPDEVFVIQ